MQHVAKISCKNGVEGGGERMQGRFYRIMFNMLHNLLLNNANIGW